VDTALLFDYFETNEWSVCSSISRADLVVVSACAFDAGSEERGFGLLAAADRKRRMGSRMIVIGCIAGISPELLRRTFNALAIPPSEMSRFDELIGATAPIEEAPDPHAIEPRVEQAAGCFGYAGPPAMRLGCWRGRRSRAVDSVTGWRDTGGR
jgi:tRNA A37 methylthiotransferase MiaB